MLPTGPRKLQKPLLFKGVQYHPSWNVSTIDDVLALIDVKHITVLRTDESKSDIRGKYKQEKVSVYDYVAYVKKNDSPEKLYLMQSSTEVLNIENIQKVHNWSSFSSFFWLGRKGTTASLHFDYSDNVNYLLLGKKKWVLIDPATIKNDSSGLRNFHAVANPKDKYDRTQYPYFDTAKYIEFVQEKGDVVYIPRGWWHMVETLELSFAINHWNIKSRYLSRTMFMKIVAAVNWMLSLFRNK